MTDRQTYWIAEFDIANATLHEVFHSKDEAVEYAKKMLTRVGSKSKRKLATLREVQVISTCEIALEYTMEEK